MNRFWSYTGPLIECVAPRRIVEIGADLGWNTQYLAAYCRRSDCHLDIIEIEPSAALKAVLTNYGPEHYTLHVGKSLSMIQTVTTPDIVMLDGDHNWRTVYHELTSLHSTARSRGKPFPIVLAHDCAWPYARRDMYYNPGEFTDAERKPFAYKGILPGVSELVDDGINGRLANALVEGGPENGVLTAIEDFIAAQGGIRLWTLPFFNGLGIIVPEDRLTPDLQRLIDSFYSADSLMQACKALEADGMRARAETLAERRRLEQRTAALERARRLLAERSARIAELESQRVGEHASAK